MHRLGHSINVTVEDRRIIYFKNATDISNFDIENALPYTLYFPKNV